MTATGLQYPVKTIWSQVSVSLGRLGIDMIVVLCLDESHGHVAVCASSTLDKLEARDAAELASIRLSFWLNQQCYLLDKEVVSDLDVTDQAPSRLGFFHLALDSLVDATDPFILLRSSFRIGWHSNVLILLLVVNEVDIATDTVDGVAPSLLVECLQPLLSDLKLQDWVAVRVQRLTHVLDPIVVQSVS